MELLQEISFKICLKIIQSLLSLTKLDWLAMFILEKALTSMFGKMEQKFTFK